MKFTLPNRQRCLTSDCTKDLTPLDGCRRWMLEGDLLTQMTTILLKIHSSKQSVGCQTTDLLLERV